MPLSPCAKRRLQSVILVDAIQVGLQQTMRLMPDLREDLEDIAAEVLSAYATQCHATYAGM